MSTQHTADKTDIEGPGGIEMTGGDLTPPQNAGALLDQVNDERRGEQQMQRRQMAGGVAEQTTTHSPSTSNLEGVPHPVSGRDTEAAEEKTAEQR